MPTPTYTLINSITIGSGGVSSISFTSIPATYTDFQVLYSFRTTDTAAGAYNDIKVTLNGNNAAASGKVLYAIAGNVVGSYSPTTTQSYFGSSTQNAATANTFCNGMIYVSNYAGSTAKSISGDVVGENNSTNAALALTAGYYSSTSAVTDITFIPAAGYSFVEYTTAYIYGIKNS